MPTIRLGLEQAVIDTLASRWPLCAKELAITVSKAGFDGSYATVRKCAIKLADEHILSIHDKEFSLSPEWLSQVKMFAEEAQKRYNGKPTIEGIESIESSAEFWFGNVRELDSFFVSLSNTMDKKLPRDVPMCWRIAHTWWPIFHSQGEHDIHTSSSSPSDHFYTLCEKDSAIDRWCRDVQNRMGNNMKHVPGNSSCDCMICGNMILQIYLPKEFMTALEKLYRAKSIDKLDINALLELMVKPMHIRVLILKNAELAATLRAGVMKHFGK